MRQETKSQQRAAVGGDGEPGPPLCYSLGSGTVPDRVPAYDGGR